MLGLMASRPKELSLEGTQFGGGHGAFTYSVMKGLEGSADQDNESTPSMLANSSITFAPTYPN